MGSSAATPATGSGNMPALSVDELQIKDGSATVASIPAAGNPFTCTAINLTVKQFSLRRRSLSIFRLVCREMAP